MKKINVLLLIAFTLYSTTNPAYGINDGVIVPGPNQGVSNTTGKVYYTKIKEGEVLIKTNFWGAVAAPGIHYLPDGTDIVTGLSIAGGPGPHAVLDDVRIIRASGKMLKMNLESPSDLRKRKFKLKPGDIVHVEKSHFWERLPLWLALGSFVISSVSIYVAVKDD